MGNATNKGHVLRLSVGELRVCLNVPPKAEVNGLSPLEFANFQDQGLLTTEQGYSGRFYVTFGYLFGVESEYKGVGAVTVCW